MTAVCDDGDETPAVVGTRDIDEKLSKTFASNAALWTSAT